MGNERDKSEVVFSGMSKMDWFMGNTPNITCISLDHSFRETPGLQHELVERVTIISVAEPVRTPGQNHKRRCSDVNTIVTSVWLRLEPQFLPLRQDRAAKRISLRCLWNHGTQHFASKILPSASNGFPSSPRTNRRTHLRQGTWNVWT